MNEELLLQEQIFESREFGFGYFYNNRLGFIFEYETNNSICFRRIEIETSDGESLSFIYGVYIFSESLHIFQHCIVVHGTGDNFHTHFFIFVCGVFCIGIECIESEYAIIFRQCERRSWHDLCEKFS